jgi:hypothetical protein
MQALVCLGDLEVVVSDGGIHLTHRDVLEIRGILLSVHARSLSLQTAQSLLPTTDADDGKLETGIVQHRLGDDGKGITDLVGEVAADSCAVRQQASVTI